MTNLAQPGNPRYQPKQTELVFGYNNLYRTLAEVELAGLDVLGEIEIISAAEMAVLTPELREMIMVIPTTEVDKVEREITKHDVRAWVRLAQKILAEASAGFLGRWTHIPFTSYDPLNTGRILQFLRAYKNATLPAAKEVVRILSGLCRQFADQIQIGRTHGQHALPITVGFWLATILHRIVYNLLEIDRHANALTGKVSGAVGAYNAQIGLGIEALCGQKTFEERVLEKLGLKPSLISTQILPPEPLEYLLHAYVMLSAALAQFGRDGRNLMRTEIAEFAEGFEIGQVGSSTMAHKRNPINFENLEGMFWRTKNELGKVLDMLISEHQRDLVGSCVARDYPIIVINIQQQLNTLLGKNKQGVPFLERLTVSPEACQRNFEMSAGVILAEPMYIALQMAGYPGDAHELVNHTLMPISQERRIPLIQALEETALQDEELQKALNSIPEEVINLFATPQNYTGKASHKAREIADWAEDKISRITA